MPSQDSPNSYFGTRSGTFFSSSRLPDTRLIIRPARQRRHISRRVFWFVGLGLLLLVLNVWSMLFSAPQAFAATRPPVVLKGAPSRPNLMSPAAGSTTSPSPYHPAPEGSAPIGQPQSILHTVPLSMNAGSLALLTTKATRFLGSDGHLEVNIPATAISAQDQQQAGGALHVQVSEIAPPSGSNAGGSGHLSLGTYLLQLVDANGVLVNHGLHAPITVTYHYNKQEAALNLDHAYLVQNGARPPQGIKTAAMKTNVALANTFGVTSSQAVQLNTTQSTLQATPLLNTPSTSLTWQSDVSIGTFGKPDPFNVDLSAGGLTSELPIDVPAGPGGLTPPVSLNYSSEGVNNQHNPTGATGWVGEGWNLNMGSINWAEHNVYAGCKTTACAGGANWENTWELSDPYGTSSELIPPNINVSTYYDDSTNKYCDASTGTATPYPCPILWHTATETHTKIYAYVGPNSLPQMSAKPPCFRVWRPNGVMEEFGCTPDSLQHYYQASVGAHLVSSWLLDLITDPQGNQIHFTYQQDITKVTGTPTAIRDVALSTIEYDAPNCHNAQTMCTGTNWNPLVRLNFQASHAPRLSGAAPSGCNTGANLRCDDPLDLSSSGGITAPEVQSTFVLNDIQVQVRTSGSASWNTLHDYRLGYEESGPTTITDPSTGKKESVAGMLDMTQFQELGTAAALPMRTFSYTSQTNYYEDDQFTANSSGITKCGPSWNTGNGGSGCLLWSQSYANNNRFLSSVSNGQGLAQTFGWALARSNTHGVPGGGANNGDPLYCNSHQSGYPCNEADDQSWSHVILTQRKNTTTRLTQNGQGGAQTQTPINDITDYYYQLSYPLASQQCSDCVAGFYWGNQNDSDYLSYYNNKFMGFAQVKINLSDNTEQVHKFYATQGIGIYDTSQVTCYAQHPCHASPWWNLNNAAHGHEYDVSYYDTDKTTLLKHTANSYKAVCPPAGVAPTPASTDAGKTYTWDGNLVSELDHNNPVAVCDVQQTQSVSQVSDGSSSNVSTTTTPTYDSYGRVTKVTTTSNGGTPSQVVQNTSYVWNDGVTATRTSASGTYIIDTPAFTDTEDGSGNRLQCSSTSYDGKGYATGQTSNLIGGQATSQTDYTDCGNASNSYTTGGAATTTTAYDAYGNAIGTTDADANAGISGHTGCSVGSTQYTDCSAYDSTFNVYQTGETNALNQGSTTSYANTNALFGYGTWPASTTDANHQTTSYTYDSLGRMTGETLPGESAGNTTKQWTYTDWCSGTAAQTPCVEIDEMDRLDSTTTTTTRAFYDGEGRLVETRKPGPGGQDIVTYAYYDQAERQIFKSNPYFVTAYTGVPGAAAYSIPDSTQPGTSTTYINERQTSVTDPNSHTTTTIDSVTCGVAGTSDTGCYEQTMIQDASGHEAATFTGALGKVNYKQTYTGNSSSTYTRYALTMLAYDAAGNLLSTTSPDGSVATATYDATGQMIEQTDPDKGTSTATYDPNGNLTQSVDARGSAGTVYAGYDGLNRVLWRNNANSANGAWVTYSYGSTDSGNNGIGQLTSESFTGSGNLSGSYAYTYDARGQQLNSVTTVNGTGYTTQATYNDAGQPLTQTYPTGETVTPGYSSTGWLTGMTTSAGGTTTLASNITYSGLAGAGGQISSMSLGNGTYTYSASYDTGLRLTSAGLTNTSSGNQLYQTQPTYDAISNVIGVQTSIGNQTDTQQFCYDDLNRLTWSGTNGTPPCSGASITAGTLTDAQYQQSNSYNIDGGLTSGPNGTYSYGDSNHPHAVTSTSSGYSASYDAVGNMLCRATSNSTSCSGSSLTGQQLTYDAEGRLSSWQDQPTLPGQIMNYLYDGEGHRVAMQSNVSGTTTLTAYIGSIEEVQTTGSTTQTTTFYTVGSKRVAADVNGTFYYFGYDALGSQVAVLDATGSLVGAQLYGPYGASRYNTGTIPTSIGFTGQRADSVTGLDYYGARYYDPVVGVFLSADDVQGNMQGMEPYVYVMGNPETNVDPTGHWFWGTMAITVGVVSLGIVIAAAVGFASIVAAPLIVAAAGGALAAFALAAVIGGSTGAFTSEDNFDNWGVRTLISEGIGAATSAFAAAAGNAVQGFAENTNISTWGKMPPTTDISPVQSASANQAGQSLGSSLTGLLTYPVDVSHIHAPGIKSGSKPSVHHTSPALRRAPAPRRTYTYKSTRSYRSWTQTYSGYNYYTYSNYSYIDTVYHYTNPSYNYEAFSASNGYYERSNGRTHMS